MLVDSLNRPLRDLRISVTDRCNFRCGYCMPKDIFGKGYSFLKSSSILSYEEIALLVSIFSELGVRKIRLTGGEPLLRKDLEVLISKIAEITQIEDIAITTNASLLTKQRAISLKDAGINRINISLDALTPSIYQKINQIPYPIEEILKGINAALEVGFETVKVNMVVQKNINAEDILPMVSFFRETEAILRFIEFMDVGNHNDWNIENVFSSQETIDLIHSVYPLEPVDANYHAEVANRWRYIDGKGEIGVISSISQPFCGGCARARLSAKGELFTCLFAESGYDLRQLLNAGMTDEQIREKISTIWTARTDQYSIQRSKNLLSAKKGKTNQKVEMSYIGG